MSQRIAHLVEFIQAIMGGQPHLFQRAVKEAYKAGATREELLTAVEIGRVMGHVSGPVVSQAYATVHAWHWLAARRMEHLRNLTRS
jgi:alkylhydroperoxidase/carboxymuconolactone decarboxylase family protein YurZ